MTNEAIISAISDGIRDVRMKEELAIHEELCTALEMFNMATKCARAEEGRLSLLELPAADPEEKKSKAKDVKHKGVVVLVAEPDTKRGGTTPSHLTAAIRFAPSTTYTATTPTTAKSLGPFEMDASVDAPSATTEATT